MYALVVAGIPAVSSLVRAILYRKKLNLWPFDFIVSYVVPILQPSPPTVAYEDTYEQYNADSRPGISVGFCVDDTGHDTSMKQAKSAAFVDFTRMILCFVTGH